MKKVFVNFAPKKINVNGRKKFIQRVVRICFGGGGKRGWFGKHLEVSVFGSKRRRRSFFSSLHSFGADIRLYAPDNGNRNRQKNAQKSAFSIPKNQSKIQKPRHNRLHNSDDDNAILLRYRRLGDEIRR